MSVHLRVRNNLKSYNDESYGPGYDKSTCSIQDITVLLFGYEPIIKGEYGDFDDTGHIISY